jgi:hypothetical protein
MYLSYLVIQVLKYVLEGLAVGIAAYLISGISKKGRSLSFSEIAAIALTASATFVVLDLFAPTISISARQGSGFGLGAQTVGFGVAAEAFEDLQEEEVGDSADPLQPPDDVHDDNMYQEESPTVELEEQYYDQYESQDVPYDLDD